MVAATVLSSDVCASKDLLDLLSLRFSNRSVSNVCRLVSSKTFNRRKSWQHSRSVVQPSKMNKLEQYNVCLLNYAKVSPVGIRSKGKSTFGTLFNISNQLIAPFRRPVFKLHNYMTNSPIIPYLSRELALRSQMRYDPESHLGFF